MVVTTHKKTHKAPKPMTHTNQKKPYRRSVDDEMVRRAARFVIDLHRDALKELERH